MRRDIKAKITAASGILAEFLDDAFSFLRVLIRHLHPHPAGAAEENVGRRARDISSGINAVMPAASNAILKLNA